MTRARAAHPWRRRLWRAFLFLLALVVLGAGLLHCAPFGGHATGARRERMERSPQWHHGHFQNPQPIINSTGKSLHAMLHPDPNVRPKEPVAVVQVEKGRFATPPASGMRVTWFGHSSTLLEVDGHRFLLDPIWSEHVGPVNFAGPERWYPPLIKLADLPPLDAVVISHDHFDHLDYQTVRALAVTGVRFIVPLGIGAHLERWGVSPSRITELDWWQSASLGDFTLACTPSRHESGRQLTDMEATLWSSWAFLGPQHRVFYSGDTGLFPGFREIGDRLGPFDLTLFETGQYNAGWPDWHLGPEQAVKAHTWVRGKVMMPVHWGLFVLASHAWTEPIERVLIAAKERHVTVIAPRPGESVDPLNPPPVQRWWPTLPFHTAEQDPIVADQVAP